MGRFTSPDEFTGGPDELFDFSADASDNPTFYGDLTNPQSLNKYLYCYNSPLIYIDPDGHQQALTQRLLLERGHYNKDFEAIGKLADTLSNPFKLNKRIRKKLRKMIGTDRASLIRRGIEGGLPEDVAIANADVAIAFNDQIPVGVGGISKVRSLTRGFGFRAGAVASGEELSARGGVLISGELANGGSVAVNLVKTSEQLGVRVTDVFSKVPGTLKAIEEGAINVARQTGASSVRFVAVSPNDRVLNLLIRKGFTQVIRDGKPVNEYEKIIRVSQ